jgi:hypothetical protein
MLEVKHPEMAGLGPVIRVFKPNPVYQIGWLFRLFGGAAFFGLFGMLFLQDGLSGIVMLVLAAGSGIAGLWILLQRLLSAKDLYLVCENGLVLVTSGDRPETLRWEDIAEFRYDVVNIYSQPLYLDAQRTYKRTSHRFVIHHVNGRRIVLDDSIADVERLGSMVQKYSAQARLPEAIKQWELGLEIKFGPLTLSREGFHNGREMFPWSEITYFDGENGYITVEHGNNRQIAARISSAQLPDTMLLIFLLQRILKMRHQAAVPDALSDATQ